MASIVTEALIRSGSRHAQTHSAELFEGPSLEYVASWKHESVLIQQERSFSYQRFREVTLSPLSKKQLRKFEQVGQIFARKSRSGLRLLGVTHQYSASKKLETAV